MEIVGFLEGKTPDHRGRILAMLLQQTDYQAETTHDYIQWLFPLDEPSRSVNGVPVLTQLEIDEIRQSSLAQANLAKSSRKAEASLLKTKTNIPCTVMMCLL